MLRRRGFTLRPRWALPSGAMIATGGVLAGTMLASAAAPALPRQTPAQLIASMRNAHMPRDFSATLTETANLGFPSLPSIGGMSSSPLSPTSLMSGSHTIQVWSAGPRHLRIALPVSFGETDLRVNGNKVWLWESQGQKATRIVPPGPTRHYMRAGPGQPGKAAPAGKAPGPDWSKLSPLQAAKKALAMVGPTTRVTIPGTTSVAGRNAYLLAIAPRTRQSLVGRVLIAIDAKTRLPLSVQVFARRSSSAAFAIKYTSLSFAKPAMSNFIFTPPPGAHVKVVHPQVAPGGPIAIPGVPPAHLPAALRKRLARAHRAWVVRPGKAVPEQAVRAHGGWSGLPPAAIRKPMAGVRTFGTGWLTVAAIPAAGAMTLVPATPSSAGFVPAKGGSTAVHRNLAIAGQGPASGSLAILGALMKAARHVRGSWGSGRLLRTNLVSVLVTSKGEILVGAVTPNVLFADAAKLK